MSNIILHSEPVSVPAPSVPISIRPATMADAAFMDELQKQHSKQLGFFPRAQIEGYITNGWVLVAETATGKVGYVASRDRYLKRDELGIVYQLCVRKDVQRGHVGAALLQAVSDRSAYGCRLYCCWCAQDLAANRFWEAMGFVPIAFRGGSDKKKRVHIFWQKRIRRGDTTPWWFPSKTESGALRADRLVLPIPAGMRWDEEMPVVVSDEPVARRPRQKRQPEAPAAPVKRPVQFGRPGTAMPVAETPATQIVKSPTPQLDKPKCDPKLIAAARELRDRWLEQVNSGTAMIESAAKYDCARALPTASDPKLLAA